MHETLTSPKSLLEIKTLQDFDKNEMYKVYDNWPEIARQTYEKNHEAIDIKNISQIIFAGMGGSGAINDVFSSILSKTNIPSMSVKSHILPNSVTSDTLVVITSITGNTGETLSVLDSARRLGAKIIAFSSGGKIRDYCKENSLEFRTAPMLNSPRSSYPSFLYTMIKVLEPVLQIKNSDIIESISSLEQTKKIICSSNLDETNKSLELAHWITKIPLIYYPQGLRAAAIRFKNSLQENAKSHVMVEECGEACHNGIVSWEVSSCVQPILLQGQDDHMKTKERWKIFREYFDEKNIEYKEVFSVKGSLLSKLVNLTYMLDYTSIYRAIFSRIDPFPITSTEFVKQRLATFKFEKTKKNDIHSNLN